MMKSVQGLLYLANSEVTINSKKLTTAYDLKITAAKDLIIKNSLKKLSQKSPLKRMALAAIQIIGKLFVLQPKKF